MALRNDILPRYACGDHCRSLDGTWLSTRGGWQQLQANRRQHERCCLETSTYDGSSNFDFKDVSFQTHADTPDPSPATSECSFNAFDHHPNQ